MSRIFSSTQISLRPPAGENIACYDSSLLGSESSLQATCCDREDASAQRAAPGRAKLLSTSLRRRRFRRKCCHSSVSQPCNFALTNRPCSHHFPPIRNFLRTKRCTNTFFNVLTLHWQNLSRIHRANLELWTETCHHFGFSRFEPKICSSPRLGIM